MHHRGVGNVGSACVASDHAEAPDEPAVGDVDQVTVPHALNGKDVVRYNGDREDWLGAADDRVQIVVIDVIVAIVSGAISVVVTVRGGRVGRIGTGRRQDVVGADDSDARLGGRLKR